MRIDSRCTTVVEDTRVDPSTRAHGGRVVGSIYDRVFQEPDPNRFDHLFPRGRNAYPLLLRKLESRVEEKRIDALLMLGRMFEAHGATEDALRAVVENARRMTGPDVGPERQAALFALAKSGNTRLLRRFLAMLESEEPVRIAAACYALGYAKVTKALPALERIASSDRADRVRVAAVWALGEIGGFRARRALLELLGRRELVDWVIRALGEVGDPGALEPLASFLRDPIDLRRFSAITAIEAIVRETSSREQPRWLIPVLREAAQDRFAPVAIYALVLLTQLGEESDG